MLPNGGGNSSQWIAILAKVKLEQFAATPTEIGPFGESTIRWVVSGPATGFSLTLNGVAVARAGSQLVQPVVTTAYALVVRAGEYSRTLGYVSVQVDLDACMVVPQPAGVVHSDLETFVRVNVLASNPKLYFNSAPSVTFSSGLIQVAMHLGLSVNDFPDPSIDATLQLGLAVVNGALQAADPLVTGTVSEPWWVYAIPGAEIGVGIQVSDAQDALPMDFAPLAAGMAEYISLFLYPAGQGMRYQSVMIQSDPTNAPIQLTVCPTPRVATVGIIPSILGSARLQ